MNTIFHRCDKKASFKQGEHTDDEKYHAYIACCYNDVEVVNFAKTLKEDLTNKGYKCISDEDNDPGKSILNTICSNIEMSRRVILLMSSKNNQ